MLEPTITDTGDDRVRRQLYLTETMTPRLLKAMKTALPRLAE